MYRGARAARSGAVAIARVGLHQEQVIVLRRRTLAVPRPSTRKAVRGPAIWQTTAPTTSPVTGPAAIIARIRPLRRAAPVGSAVARAWVAMFIAANDRPQSS